MLRLRFMIKETMKHFTKANKGIMQSFNHAIKNAHEVHRVYSNMAENERFELSVACTTPPFQDGALNRSANSPVPSYYNKFLCLVIPFLYVLVIRCPHL